MRYVVVGAGAIGGLIGAELARHGREVLLIARGAHLARLREQRGIGVLTPDGASLVPAPAVGLDDYEPRDDDALLVAVKQQDSAAALATIAARPTTSGAPATTCPVVCVQNGVAGERIALRLFRRVYGCYVRVPATHLEPGLVIGEAAPVRGILDLGKYPDGADRTVEQIAVDLSDSAFSSVVRPDIMAWKYDKLLGNLGNAADAVLGLENAESVLATARAEARAVFAAAGIEVADSAEVDARADGWVQMGQIEGHQRVGGSSRQSLLRGTGSIEADYLNGEIAQLGRLHGIATPMNEALQWWANRLARAGGAPGSVALAEFTASLEQFA